MLRAKLGFCNIGNIRNIGNIGHAVTYVFHRIVTAIYAGLSKTLYVVATLLRLLQMLQKSRVRA